MGVTLEQKKQRLIAAILREQKKAFRKHLVRDPRGKGSAFCEPRKPSLQEPLNGGVFEDVTLAALRHNHPPPALIHAYQKTGMLIRADTIDGAKTEDLKRWYAAAAEYFAVECKARAGFESHACH